VLGLVQALRGQADGLDSGGEGVQWRNGGSATMAASTATTSAGNEWDDEESVPKCKESKVSGVHTEMARSVVLLPCAQRRGVFSASLVARERVLVFSFKNSTATLFFSPQSAWAIIFFCLVESR